MRVAPYDSLSVSGCEIGPIGRLMNSPNGLRWLARGGLAILALGLGVRTAPGQVRTDLTPVRVWVGTDRAAPVSTGAGARVFLQIDDDGYVLVLKADAAGRAQVIFPLEPGDDNFVRGGVAYEVLGRDGRPALTGAEPAGTGVLLAIRSDEPFRFERLTRNGSWDPA